MIKAAPAFDNTNHSKQEWLRMISVRVCCGRRRGGPRTGPCSARPEPASPARRSIACSRSASERQAQIDFENEGGETYICGNPPYIWGNNQTPDQKQEILLLGQPFGMKFKGLDYVSGWIYKYALYSRATNSDAAFVATNSITQGEQVDPLWSGLLKDGCSIFFAYRSFKWQNLAKSNAGVLTCAPSFIHL